MITDEQVKQAEDQIKLLAQGAAPWVSLLGPKAVTALVVGQIVAVQVPKLVAIVERAISGAPPTDAELTQLRAEIALLKDPNLP